jgi:polar amino acid transport system substrate-binding protein
MPVSGCCQSEKSFAMVRSGDMKKKIFLFFLSVMTYMVLLADTFAETKIIYFASLEWPPYTGKELPDQGISTLVARSAFAAVGYEIRVDFYPWARTLMVARESEKYAGYFPEYYAEKIEKDFIFSDAVGESPLGFAERKSNPVSWRSLDDLRCIKDIGTVRGYVNTEEFDKMAANGGLDIDPVTDDATNLRKVAAGRIRMAVIDRYVMQYILSTNNSLNREKNILQFNSRLLENKKLYLCFHKARNGEHLAAIFNNGLKKIDIKKMTEAYFYLLPKTELGKE